MWKEQIDVTATGAEKGSSTRSSDYRTKASVHVEMGRTEAPEGVKRLVDQLSDIGEIAKNITKARLQIEAQKAAAKLGITHAAPVDGAAEEPPDGGGDSEPEEEETGTGTQTDDNENVVG